MLPPAVVCVTVTFRTTADTPEAGTPPCPVTARWIVPPAATGPVAPCRILVSRMREGDSGTKLPGGAAATVAGRRDLSGVALLAAVLVPARARAAPIRPAKQRSAVREDMVVSHSSTSSLQREL